MSELRLYPNLAPVTVEVRPDGAGWSAIVWVNVPPIDLVAVHGRPAATPVEAVVVVAEVLAVLDALSWGQLRAWAQVYAHGDDPTAVARSVSRAWSEQ